MLNRTDIIAPFCQFLFRVSGLCIGDFYRPINSQGHTRTGWKCNLDMFLYSRRSRDHQPASQPEQDRGRHRELHLRG